MAATAETVAPATPAQVPTNTSLVAKFASKFGVEPNKMVATLKATAFRQGANDPEVTNEQMMALLVVADQYNLNPWTREIYAFADKYKGVVPIVSIDGWSRIINEHREFNGFDLEYGPPGEKHKGAPEWIDCTIHRKDRAHPTTIRERLIECYRDTGPWNSHPSRMLRHKALIQCARTAFGFAGIYDEDEAQRIIEGTSTRIDESPAIREINETIAPTKPEPAAAPALTYARLMDLFQAAHEKRDVDLLDAHCTLVTELPEGQREQAIGEYKRIRKEIEA